MSFAPKKYCSKLAITNDGIVTPKIAIVITKKSGHFPLLSAAIKPNATPIVNPKNIEISPNFPLTGAVFAIVFEIC